LHFFFLFTSTIVSYSAPRDFFFKRHIEAFATIQKTASIY
jgi:hypothetical protein